MHKPIRPAIFALLMFSTLVVHGQQFVKSYYARHTPDFAVGAAGQFTRDISNNNRNQLYNANSVGFLGSMRQPLFFHTKLELNYGYTRYRQQFVFGQTPTVTGTATVKPGVHEATGALLIHPHFMGLSPFLGAGGGYINFRGFQEPNHQGPNQFRGTGLAEAGFDIATSNKNMGFRLEGRSLFYRDPNYDQPRIANSGWQATIEPVAQVWVKF